jgi:hypothetical protein
LNIRGSRQTASRRSADIASKARLIHPLSLQLVERRQDGIAYYNKLTAVDEPLVAKVSADGTWIVSSFSRTTGNVCSNPELT